MKTESPSRWFRLFVVLGSLLVAPFARAIDSPPTLVDLQLPTPTVNTEFAPANVIVRAEISDAAPGVCTSVCDDYGTATQIAIVHRPTGQRHTALFDPLGGGLYQALIVLPEQSAIGAWEIESLWLADLAGNRRVLPTALLGGAGYPTMLNNIAMTGDDVAPGLSAASVSPAFIDASGGALIAFSVSVDDPTLCTSGCEVEGGPSQVRYRHAPTGQIRNGLLRPDGTGFSAQVLFPSGSADGLWTVDALHLVDLLGNRTILDASDLSGLGLMTDLTVTSSSADLLPPQLVGSINLPDPIDSTSAGLIAVFQIDANDPDTGLCLGSCDDDGTPSQVIYKRLGSDHFRFGVFDRIAGSDFSGTFETGVAIPQSGSPAVWMPYRLMLVDRAGNRRFVPEPGFAPGLLLLSFALTRFAAVRPRRER